MKVQVISGDITRVKVDASIVNLFEGVQSPGGATGAVNEAMGGVITNLISSGEIKGKLNEITLIHTMGKLEPERIVVVGLGKQEKFSLDTIRQVAAITCRYLRRIGVKRAATVIHGAGAGGIEAEKAVQALAEGSLLGLYNFRNYITKEPEYSELEELLIVERDEGKVPSLAPAVERGRILAEATNFARDLVNQPANHMTPSDMADIVKKLADTYGLELSILDKKEIEDLGMGALLGVAQGSKQPPKFIIISYKGGDPSSNPLGLIGKGLTFDSGGISIKPSEGMDEMKGDMAGGAAVIAAIKAIAEIRPGINVMGLIPATENLPGGAALKPGDILKAMNGKTIEVVNTDAEGRLILADALSYANKLGLSPLIDVATLTGACRVALGDICTGAFGNNEELIAKVIRAGEEAGEKIWQLPMYEEYKEKNKSDVADIKNTGGRYAGAITAAQFLAEFSQNTPWTHLDIAGPFYTDKERGYVVKGATGVAVRTLVNLVLALAEERSK